MRKGSTWGALLLAPVLLSCQVGDAQSDTDTAVRPAFLAGDTVGWLAAMDSMTIREKVGQIMMVPLYSKPGEPGSAADVQAAIEQWGIGGVIAMQGDTATTRYNLSKLDSVAQSRSGFKLLTAMDAEWGAGMRLPDGITFPKAMALGATEREDLIRQAGRAAGIELRRLGVGIDFAPVADVNSNPDNPVIGNRSFGSRPDLAGALSSAWAEGLREAGVMSVGKHFPGHGDADLDSHLALPVISSDSATLASTELPPFKALIHRGIDGIMTAHLDVPALDSITGLPTSLSPKVIRDLLLDSLGFEGLVFTDALTMAGAADPVPPGVREVAALKAGNDVLLFPSEPALVLDSICAALRRGELDTSRIDEACLKVLLAKQWTSEPPLNSTHAPNLHGLQERIRAHMLVRLGTGRRLDHGVNTALVIAGNRGEAAANRLALAIPALTVVRLPKGEITAAEQRRIAEAVNGMDQVVVAFIDESNRPKRRYGLPRGANGLLEALSQDQRPLFVTLFTSPYALSYLTPSAQREWMVAHHEDDMSQAAAMAAWCGEGDALGFLPVNVGGWQAGQGNPTKAHRLPRAVADDKWTAMAARLDSLAGAAIDLASTPGMRILVVADDSVRYDGAHGHLGDSAQTPVQRHHVYDLASITKVATSTLLTMMTMERGMLDLEAPLSSLLPKNEEAPLNPTLGSRTVRDLLAHRSGLPAWIPFYVDLMAHEDSIGGVLSTTTEEGWIQLCEGKCMHPMWRDSITRTIRAIEPKAPGQYRYSDLGYYLLKDILESRWGRPLEQLADSLIHRPLGLQNMGYLPLEWSCLADIAPTENDTVFRQSFVHGTVHDPGAAMLGGVAGHAGLFSDAHDLAILMEAMRLGGTWKGTRLVRAETVERFTQRAFPSEENRRGLGWDKPGLEPDTGASGNAGSWGSFGHSGFTGTLAWTDPDAGWTVVILGNRICPDAENRTYIDEDIRTKALSIVQDAVGTPSRFTASEHPQGSGH
ncbi:MAG: serine hydrolase [Flavobacteriales bacterium]|nr:serine hydrolase [Flavobacteriales bacterium]